MALSGMRYPHYGQGNGTFALDADGTAKFGIGHATGAWNTIEPALIKCGLPYSEAINIEQILEHLETYSPPSPNLSIPVSTRNRIYNWTNQFLNQSTAMCVRDTRCCCCHCLLAIFPLTLSVGIHGALLRKWWEGDHPSTADGSGGGMLTEDL